MGRGMKFQADGASVDDLVSHLTTASLHSERSSVFVTEQLRSPELPPTHFRHSHFSASGNEALMPLLPWKHSPKSKR